MTLGWIPSGGSSRVALTAEINSALLDVGRILFGLRSQFYLGHDWGDILELLSLDEVDQFDAHGVSTGLPDLINSKADHLSCSGDEHDFIGFVNRQCTDHFPGPVPLHHDDNPLSTSFLLPILRK